jgi:hypothetical protein
MAENTSPEAPRSRRTPSVATALPTGGLFGMAGYSLLLFGLYSLVTVMLGGEGRQDAVWGRMVQILSLFPLLFLAPILIFSTPEARLEADNIWRAAVKWLVLMLAIIYLLFIPVALLNEFNTNQLESNKINRLNTMLQKRRKQIMASLSSLSDPGDFETTLKQFPEVSNINIVAAEGASKIRASIDRDISLAIDRQVSLLRVQNQERIGRLSATVRNLCVGSLVTGFSMLALASRLIPWLGRSSQILANTTGGIGRWLMGFFAWASKPALILQQQLEIMRRDLLGLIPGWRPTRKRHRRSRTRSKGGS